MARHGRKVLPARKPVAIRDEDSLLIESAESLGRVVGSLQRQIQGAGRRLSSTAEAAIDAMPELPRMEDVLDRARAATGIGAAPRKSGSRKASGARKASNARPASSRKTAATAKTAGARKAAGTRKAVPRKPAAARRRRKTSGR